MPCVCSAQLAALPAALRQLPPLSSLVPVLPAGLVAAVASGPSGVSAMATATGQAEAQASANLAAMASLAADLKAALGVNLLASLSGAPRLCLQASLSETLSSLNGQAGVLDPMAALLEALMRELANLLALANLVGAAQAAWGIDLRTPGAVAALQARLDARAQASARAAVTATAHAQASVVERLMAHAGMSVTSLPQLGATLQATASLHAGLPSLRVSLRALSALAALLAMVAAIVKSLGVPLASPHAALMLRANLGALPLAALAQMRVSAQASATATAQARAQASAAVSAQHAAALAAAARVNLAPMGPVMLAMRVAASPGMLAAPGSCGRPCAVAAARALA